MLSWFPTPYPEEWWYSVLCRYYVRAGIKHPQIVKKMLFEGRSGARIGTIFPNQTIAQVVSQLPQNLFNTRQMILEHTPFRYYARMYPIREQKEMMESLCNGYVVQLTHLWKSFRRAAWAPRYCPMCVQEDRRVYGEPYWHVDHQIPLMSVCPRHHCRLTQIDISPLYPTLNNRFFPLSDVDVAGEPNRDYEEWEERVSVVAREYWKMPLSVRPSEGHNNLIQTLKNNGYLMIMRKDGTTLDREKLLEDLVALYGKDRVNDVFENLDGGVILRITRWEHLLPDRYIFLQALAGLSTNDVFSEEPISDHLKERLTKMTEHNVFRSKRQAAREMGMREYELNSLIRLYGMRPFWMEPEKGTHPKPLKDAIHFLVTREEYEEIERRGKELGYRCAGHFALQCIRYVMAQRVEVLEKEKASD